MAILAGAQINLGKSRVALLQSHYIAILTANFNRELLAHNSQYVSILPLKE